MNDGFNSITDIVAGQDQHPGGNLLDAMYPPTTPHNAAMIHGLGLCPVNTALVDTRTVNGFALAALDLDPFTTAWLAQMR
jgi:hypothetical protein